MPNCARHRPRAIQLPRFHEASRVLCRKRPVLADGRYYYWAKPHRRLRDYDTEREPTGLIAALRAFDLTLGWARCERLGPASNLRRQRLPADSRTCRRATFQDDLVLDVAQKRSRQRAISRHYMYSLCCSRRRRSSLISPPIRAPTTAQGTTFSATTDSALVHQSGFAGARGRRSSVKSEAHFTTDMRRPPASLKR